MSYIETDHLLQGVDKYLNGQQPQVGDFKSIAELRAAMTAPETSPPTHESVTQEDRQIPVRDGSTIGIRIYRPRTPSQSGSPLMVTYHGGGWCIGSFSHLAPLCLAVCAKFNIIVVDVDYRLAPEHPFPTAAHDAIDATTWAAQNATSIGADPSKGFLLAGDSAGGNLVGVVSHHWVADKLQPPITGAHYVVPALIDSSAVPERYRADYTSWEQNKDAPILNRDAMDMFRDAYVPEASMRQDPLYSPLLWPGGHAGQPKSSFQICGLDCLRDDGLIYEKILREEIGIQTKLVVYAGLPHGFWLMLPMLEASKKYTDDFLGCIEWLLEQK